MAKVLLHKKPLNILEEPASFVVNFLSSFDTVLTDCDGVLWISNNVIEGSPSVLKWFRNSGKKIYFVTNNSTKTRAEFVTKALRLGFEAKEEEIVSTSYLVAQYLKNRQFTKKAYVIGSSGITKELDNVGISHTGVGPDTLKTNLNDFITKEFQPEEGIGAVIVGFDEHFSFLKMTKAASYLNNPDCLFIATNTDERFPMPKHIVPGTGSIVKAVETCAERPPIVIGKPYPYVCEALKNDANFLPERTLMIGDRCNTDILLGYNSGFQTLLVGTGVHTLDDVINWCEHGTESQRTQIPDFYLPSLGSLIKLLPSV